MTDSICVEKDHPDEVLSQLEAVFKHSLVVLSTTEMGDVRKRQLQSDDGRMIELPSTLLNMQRSVMAI
jgi:hypothetical protein